MELSFYKNNGRYTALLPDHYFVQINKRKTVRTVTLGRNMLICEEAMNYGVEITEHEFFYAFQEHCEETTKFIQMIADIKNNSEK